MLAFFLVARDARPESSRGGVAGGVYDKVVNDILGVVVSGLNSMSMMLVVGMEMGALLLVLLLELELESEYEKTADGLSFFCFFSFSIISVSIFLKIDTNELALGAPSTV